MSEQDRAALPDAGGEPAPASSSGLGWWTTAALAFAVSAAVTAAWSLLAPPPIPHFGKVNLAAVVKEQQQAFEELAAKGDAEASLRHVRGSAAALSGAIKRLAAECGCVILVSDAVVAGAEDLTPRFREMIRAEH